MVFKFTSDHLPICLSSTEFFSGTRPFRFFNAWGDHSDLNKVVKEVWGDTKGGDSCLWNRLKKIKGAVSKWQEDQYSSNMRRLTKCEVALSKLMAKPVPNGQVTWRT